MTLDTCTCVWLTSLRRDGSPHTVPVWFVLRDDTVFVATSVSTAKITHLRADPRVSLAFDGTGADPSVAQGRAAIHDPIDPDRWADVLAGFGERYDGWDAADPTVYGARCLIEISVDRWLLGADG